MIRKTCTILGMMLASLFATGCWDRHEINEISVVIGQGLDLDENGTYVSSGEIAIPQALGTEGGSQGGKFFVVTGRGNDIQQSLQHMRAHLSRRWFAGDRQVIFIGEHLARTQGLKGVLDEFTRNPAIRWRTDMFVVRDSTAEKVLESYYPFERLSGMADIKAHEHLGFTADLTLRNFLMAASSETACPILSDIEIIAHSSPEDPKPTRTMGDIGIFNKELKLVGFVPRHDGLLRRWIMGDLRQFTVTTQVPPDNGYVTIDLTHLKGRLVPELSGKQMKMHVLLKGQGLIRENNTHRNLSKQREVSTIEHYLEAENNRQVKALITEVQRKYQTDIFGFDSAVLRKYPYYWKNNKLQQDWNPIFKDMPISIDTQIRIKRVGITGPSAHLPGSEINE